MTRTARICAGLAGAAALLLCLAAPIAVLADTASQRLLTYGATGESWGLDVRVISVSLKEEVQDLSDSYFPHTYAEVNATPHSMADAAFFDPGPAARSGPDLINGQVVVNGGPPFVPNYPYAAHTTSDPSNRRDVDAGIQAAHTPDPLIPVTTPAAEASGFGVGTAHAHADASPKSEADAAVANLNLGGVITVASTSGNTATTQAADKVSTTTTAVLKDISIAGQLRIATETATATASVDSSGVETATSSIVYQGVTVAGTPATIDQAGLHIGGNGVPTAQAQTAAQQLGAALAPLGGKLTSSEAVSNAKDNTGTATASADGLALEFDDPSSTFQMLVSFGHAAVLGHALSEAILAAAQGGTGLLSPTTTSAAPALSASSSGGSAPVSSTGVSAASGSVTIAPTTPASTLPGGSSTKARSTPAVGARLTASQQHVLFLPVVAGLAELALLSSLLVAGWMRWSPKPPSEDDLLAL